MYKINIGVSFFDIFLDVSLLPKELNYRTLVMFMNYSKNCTNRAVHTTLYIVMFNLIYISCLDVYSMY